MIAALGAGIVVGISGIYVYYKLNRCVTRELTHLSGTIENLRREIEELKACSAQKPADKYRSPDKKVIHSSSAVNKFLTNYTSSVEDADEEYYDFTDTEDVSSTWATVNGPLESSSKISSLEDWFDEIDELLDSASSDKESMFSLMSAKKDEHSDNAEFLWRLAKVTHLYGVVAQKRGDIEKKKELAFEASGYASMAYKLDQENPEIHKWCAITIGSLGDFVGTQEKIRNGHIFKDHVDKAIVLKPLDPTLHYMRGRWCYEVAMLSWLERKVASTLFSSPPEATLEEARVHLMEADRLKPNWKENLLFVAKTYIGEGDYTSAIVLIDRALNIPSQSEDDEIAHSELETLQYRYQTYRPEAEDGEDEE